MRKLAAVAFWSLWLGCWIAGGCGPREPGSAPSVQRPRSPPAVPGAQKDQTRPPAPKAAADAKSRPTPQPTGGTSQAGNYALLVGCTRYDHIPKQFWLEGPGNDVRLVQKTLVDRFGFSPSNVTVLAEGAGGPSSRPIRKHIADAFQRLIGQVGQDDRVVVHLAGHGSWQPDDDPDNPDDVEPDGYDEVFCPADAQWGTDRRWSDVITDDQLRVWLGQLVEAGATVWLIADCCHSGTMARAGGSERVRSLRPQDLMAGGDLQRRERARPMARGSLQTGGLPAAASERPERVEGSFAALYAAQPFEATYEARQPRGAGSARVHGILTFALCQELEQMRAPLTYRQLSQRIYQRYLSDGRLQPTPLVEGRLDQLVLTKQQLAGPPQWVLERTAQTWTVNAGALHDLTVGSVLAVRPADGRQKSDQILGYVRVTDVGPLSSEVKPCRFEDLPPLREFPEQSYCEIAFLDYGLRPLKLAVDDRTESGRPLAVGRRRQLVQQLQPLAAGDQSLVRLVDDPLDADWLVRIDGQQLTLVPAAILPGQQRDADPRRFGPVPAGNPARWLQVRLRRIARATNLIRVAAAPQERGVERARPLKVKVELLPVKGSGRPDDNSQPIQWQQQGVQLAASDHLWMRVHNASGRDVDVCALFVGSNFEILQVFPYQTNADNRLAPDERITVELGNVTATTVGLEHMVVIAIAAKPQTAPADFAFLNQPTLEQLARGDSDQPLPAAMRRWPLVRLLMHTRDLTRGSPGLRRRGAKALADQPHLVRLFSWETLKDGQSAGRP